MQDDLQLSFLVENVEFYFMPGWSNPSHYLIETLPWHQFYLSHITKLLKQGLHEFGVFINVLEILGTTTGIPNVNIDKKELDSVIN